MKKFLLLAALCSIGINAQDTKKTDDNRPQNRFVAVLDANHDGELDATEINNAPAALRKLDKNNDGKLTKAELRAQRTDDSTEKPAKGDKAQKKAKKKKNLQ